MKKTERDNTTLRELMDLAVENKIWVNNDALVYLVRSGLFDAIKEKVWEEIKKGLKEPTSKAIPLELPQYVDDGGTIKEIKKVGENKWLIK